MKYHGIVLWIVCICQFCCQIFTHGVNQRFTLCYHYSSSRPTTSLFWPSKNEKFSYKLPIENRVKPCVPAVCCTVAPFDSFRHCHHVVDVTSIISACGLWMQDDVAPFFILLGCWLSKRHVQNFRIVRSVRSHHHGSCQQKPHLLKTSFMSISS